MKQTDIRNWLGIYFLTLTASVGAYILIFQETKLLPIAKSDGVSSFQIIVPVLVGQLTVIYRWIGGARQLQENEQEIDIPTWAVKGPPLAVIGIMAASIASLVVGNYSAGGGWMDSDSFKAALTFCVAILNATSVLLVMKLFSTNEQNPTPNPKPNDDTNQTP